MKTIDLVAGGNHIGIIEFGTKAARLTVAHVDTGGKFSFDAFHTISRLYQGDMTASAVEYAPALLAAAREYGICRLMVVATGAWRRRGGKAALKAVAKAAGVPVEAISTQHETELCLEAFLSSCATLPRDFSQGIMMVDQEGGSTEIGLYKHDGTVDYAGMERGTRDCAENLAKLVRSGKHGKITTTATKFWEQLLGTTNLTEWVLSGRRPVVVAAGAAPVWVTASGAARHAHLKFVTLDNLNERIGRLDEIFATAELSDDKLLDLCAHRAGLEMFRLLLTRFHFREMVVCGVGLRHGAIIHMAREVLAARQG